MESIFCGCFGWREQRRENWWSLGVFSLGPPKCFLPNPGENWRENQGLCFGQNCPSQHSDFLNFFDFFAFFFLCYHTIFFSFCADHFFGFLFYFLLFLFFLFSTVLGFLFLRKKFWVLELFFLKIFC